MKTNSSNSALFVGLLLMLILSACGASAPVATSTLPATVTSIETSALTATATVIPTKTPPPTATPNLAATQQYDDFFAVVQKIHEAGQIPSTDGKYLELDDYQDEVATKLSYEYAETGVNTKNFIVRGDFEWSNAINTTNISGCGFVFRVQQNTDHYLIVLDAFSGVKLASSTDRGTYSMGSPQNGDEKLSDFGPGPYHANFTLVVNDLKSYVYVNDVYYGEYKLLDYRITDSGLLSGAVLSATSEGYGTRCNITNIQAWIIDP
jgi:hypothetical protein